MFWPPVTILVLFCLAIRAPAAVPGATSPDGKFSVELSNVSGWEILVSVFDHSGGSKSQRWTRQVDWNVPAAGFLYYGITAHVTSDGKTVVLRDGNDVHSFARHGIKVLQAGREIVVHPRRFPELEGEKGKRPVEGVVYSMFPSWLDLLSPSEDKYALWFAQSDRWLAVSLTNFSFAVVTNATEVQRLNELGRNKALQLISEHQPEPMRKWVDALRTKLSILAPSVISAPVRKHSAWQILPAYFFIAARRDPADRKLLERLLQIPAESSFWGWRSKPTTGDSIELTAAPGLWEWQMGDYLLGVWDGQTNRALLPNHSRIVFPDRPLWKLGIVQTQVDLPIPLPDNPGSLWAYLIPAEPGRGRGPGNGALAYRFSFADSPEQLKRNRRGPVSVTFRGVHPGRYQLKFIWERKAPAPTFPLAALPTRALMWAPPHEPEPGDYQTSESDLFQIDPGETTFLPMLVCTNRIGTDPAIYAADDFWASQSLKK